MRYVMVPVPAEHVLDVMRWVLFRTPEDDGASELRDRVRLMSFLGEASETTRALLARVARAAVTDEPVRLSDVADDLDLEVDVLNAAIKDLNNFAFIVRTDHALQIRRLTAKQQFQNWTLAESGRL